MPLLCSMDSVGLNFFGLLPLRSQGAVNELLLDCRETRST